MKEESLLLLSDLQKLINQVVLIDYTIIILGCDNLAFADTFKALSDPVRRDILQLLKNGRLSAGEIASHFDMTGATISYHLNILKKADLVWETKVKNYVYYELNTSVVDEIMLWLRNLTTNMNGD